MDCLSVIYLSSVSISVYMYIHTYQLSIYLSIYLSSGCLPACVCLSSVCLSVYLHVHTHLKVLLKWRVNMYCNSGWTTRVFDWWTDLCVCSCRRSVSVPGWRPAGAAPRRTLSRFSCQVPRFPPLPQAYWGRLAPAELFELFARHHVGCSTAWASLSRKRSGDYVFLCELLSLGCPLLCMRCWSRSSTMPSPAAPLWPSRS